MTLIYTNRYLLIILSLNCYVMVITIRFEDCIILYIYDILNKY